MKTRTRATTRKELIRATKALTGERSCYAERLGDDLKIHAEVHYVAGPIWDLATWKPGDERRGRVKAMRVLEGVMISQT